MGLPVRARGIGHDNTRWHLQATFSPVLLDSPFGRDCLQPLAPYTQADSLAGTGSLTGAPSQPLDPPGGLLTSAWQIRQLSAAQSRQSLRVQLRGVVVSEAGPQPERAAVIWDGTANIYLLGPEHQFADIHRGDLVEAAGVTDPASCGGSAGRPCRSPGASRTKSCSAAGSTPNGWRSKEWSGAWTPSCLKTPMAGGTWTWPLAAAGSP